MKYTERLLKNETFLKIMGQVRVLENDRIYCHHELEHALDVARIAWIYYLEDESRERLSGDFGSCPGEAAESPAKGKEYVERKDLIYAAALLHDIGRAAQYETGVHHSIAGLQIAAGILEEIGFPEKEAQAVLAVVAEHPLSAGAASVQKAELVSDERTQEAERKNEVTEAAGKRSRNPESSQNEKNREDLLLIYITRADHDCRLCFFCEAKETCKWSKEERNQTVLS